MKKLLTDSCFEETSEPTYSIRLPCEDGYIRLPFVTRDAALLVDEAFREYEQQNGWHV